MLLSFSFPRNLRGGQMSSACKNDELIEWLWEKSQEITGVKFEDCFPPAIQKKIVNL